MGRFEIKCDVCKKKIGETDSMAESAAGGMCKKCRNDGRISAF